MGLRGPQRLRHAIRQREQNGCGQLHRLFAESSPCSTPGSLRCRFGEQGEDDESEICMILFCLLCVCLLLVALVAVLLRAAIADIRLRWFGVRQPVPRPFARPATVASRSPPHDRWPAFRVITRAGPR
jgi:hypothetical protein